MTERTVVEPRPAEAMTPAEWGRHLARTAPPITDRQAEQAARILATLHRSP